MGQNNSKQNNTSTAADDQNRQLYPIGGGHVGEGPIFNNPIAETSQQKLESTEQQTSVVEDSAVTSSGGQPEKFPHAGAQTISNPVFEEEPGPSSLEAKPANASRTDGTASASHPTPLEGSAPGETAVPIAAKLTPLEQPASPAPEKGGVDGAFAPKTPEGVVPPTASASHGSLSNTTDKSKSPQPNTAGHTSTRSAGQHEPNSQKTAVNSLPELQTGSQPAQSPPPETRAHPNTALVPEAAPVIASKADSSATHGEAPESTSAISPSGNQVPATPPQEAVRSTADTPSSRSIAPAVASRESAVPTTSTPPKTRPLVADATPTAKETIAVGNTAPAVAEPKSAGVVNSSSTREHNSASREGTPLAAETPAAALPSRGSKMGNTGSLVNQDDKVNPGGCLCFSPPGAKKSKSKGKRTIGTDAPINVVPVPAGPIGGGIHDTGKVGADAEEELAEYKATAAAKAAETERKQASTKEVMPEGHTGDTTAMPVVKDEEQGQGVPNSSTPAATVKPATAAMPVAADNSKGRNQDMQPTEPAKTSSATDAPQTGVAIEPAAVAMPAADNSKDRTREVQPTEPAASSAAITSQTVPSSEEGTADPQTIPPSGTAVSSGSQSTALGMQVAIPAAHHGTQLSKEDVSELPPVTENSRALQPASDGTGAVDTRDVAQPPSQTKPVSGEAIQDETSATSSHKATPMAFEDEPVTASAAAVQPKHEAASVAYEDSATAPVTQPPTQTGSASNAVSTTPLEHEMTRSQAVPSEPVHSTLRGQKALSEPEPTAPVQAHVPTPATASTVAAKEQALPQSQALPGTTAAEGGAGMVGAVPQAKPAPKKAVSFKQDTESEREAVAVPNVPAIPEKTTASSLPSVYEKEGSLPAASLMQKPLYEDDLPSGKSDTAGLSSTNSDFLSSAEITEMPGIGRSVPSTRDTEAGSVLVGGNDVPKPLTIPEKQVVESDVSPLAHIQREHENIENRAAPASQEGLAVQDEDFSSRAPQTAVVEVPATADATSASPITSEAAAEEATSSALAAGAAAGAENAAASSATAHVVAPTPAPASKQLSAKQSRKLEKQASKREAQARATALKEKERQDKERFKEKRKEERAHKKVQAQRMKQERATAKKSTTNVGIFGFLGGKPSKKKEEPMEKPKATPTEADAVGGQTVAAGPSQAGLGAAGAGLSGPAHALGVTGHSQGQLGVHGDAGGVQTGDQASGYMASQGIAEGGSSRRAPEGTPQVISPEDLSTSSKEPATAAPTPMTAETSSTTAGASQLPAVSETPLEASPVSAPAQTDTPMDRAGPSTAVVEVEPIKDSTAGQAVSSSTTSVAGRPQAVDVIFASPFATDSQKPVEEDLQAPLTPDQSEDTTAVATAPPLPGAKSKKTKTAKVKAPTRNIDYSALMMQRVPSGKLRDGFNPQTGKYDTSQGLRVEPGAFSPMRSIQPVLQQSASLARQETFKRKQSLGIAAYEPPTLLQSRSMAPPGRGIVAAEASANKLDYRPLSNAFV